MACDTCGPIGARAYGGQKGGRPEEDTWLPAAAQGLEMVREEGGGDRVRRLVRCPACGDHFLSWTDYEFLVGGTEDEQGIVRLDAATTERALAARWLLEVLHEVRGY
ncbi:MAG: hypothetical protein H6735_19305 [Alphaproteobacteria bacterium]|nr:hypothetical protein [Alphaproteobacteria bacterium]